MAIANESSKRWRVPALLFTGAFIGAVIFAAAHKKSVDESHDATMANAPPSHPENRVIASVEDVPEVAPKKNVALQKPGPPNPAAEKAAADSAARAAGAAEELAASTAARTN